MKVRWSRDALEDLEDIHDYVSQDAPARADKLVAALIDAAQQLETFPESGRSVPEYDESSIREVLKDPYRIVYRIQDDVIDIVTVIHGAKMLPLEPPEP